MSLKLFFFFIQNSSS